MENEIELKYAFAERIVNKTNENPEELSNLILNKCPNLEYEARFFYKYPKNHITEEQYHRLIYMFSISKRQPFQERYTNKSKNIDKFSKIRCKFVNNSITECVRKTRLTNIDTENPNPYGIRVSISNEIPASVPTSFDKGERNIERTSYINEPYRYDISKIESDSTYEFEIEYIGNEVPPDIEELKSKMAKFIRLLSFNKQSSM